jgi:hypothetical protein
MPLIVKGIEERVGATMTLENAVSRAALLSANLLAALHSPEPWFIEIGGIKAPAERVVGPHAVTFLADFPPVCFVVPPTSMYLWEGDTLRSARPLLNTVGLESVVWELEVEPGRVAA